MGDALVYGLAMFLVSIGVLSLVGHFIKKGSKKSISLTKYWLCKKCDEEIELDFEACWNCSYTKDGSEKLISKNENEEDKLDEN